MSSDKHVPKKSTKTKEKTTVSKASTSSTGTKTAVKTKREAQEKASSRKSKVSSDEKLDKNADLLHSSRLLNAPKQPTKKIEKSDKLLSKKTTSGKTFSSSNKISSDSKRSRIQSEQKTSYSKNVEKSQYFPSKSLYSNALKLMQESSKVEEDKGGLSKDVQISTKEKNILKKPKAATEIKTVKKSSAVRPIPNKKVTRTPSIESSLSEQSSKWDRPRTATLRKGSIVNENIVGPEAPKPIIPNNIPEKNFNKITSCQNKSDSSDNSNDDKYDDDFESYESDFEAVSSSEDTNLAEISGDTGSTTSSAEDISDKPNISPTYLQFDNKRLSSAGTDSERKLDSGTFELSDFKHRQILRHIEDTIKKDDVILEQSGSTEKSYHPSLSDEGFEDQRSLQFINFAVAKKKCEKKRAYEARRQRGKELLSMIKLDAINFTIFDLPSIPYEVYISNYGGYNSVQVTTQTGDENLHEETQTDKLITSSVWTQMPNKFTDFNTETPGFWERFKSELLGVGNDNNCGDFNLNSFDQTSLNKFLNKTGELVLEILSEDKINSIETIVKNKNDLPFSKGYLTFNTSSDLFKDTTIRSIWIQNKTGKKFLTLHVRNEGTLEFVKSILCQWAVDETEVPRAVLFSYGKVSCLSVCDYNENFVLAGQTDGAIQIWSLDEKMSFNQSNGRTPSFTTPIGASHFAKVVSIQTIYHQWEKDDITNHYEICSLDETGTIIFWTLYSNTSLTDANKSLSLINTRVIQLQGIYPQLPDFACSDCIIMDNQMYLSTNYGFILHYNINSSQSVIKQYTPELPNTETTTLEGCPFSPAYFLTGHSNGDIALFSKNTEKPLLVLQNKEENEVSSSQIVRWSHTKPFVFYAKDSKNNLHIWDLSKSDMYPEYTIRFPENISCLRLSPISNMENEESSFMLVGTTDGKLYLHQFNRDYGQECPEEYQKHVQIFLDYVSRL